MQCGHDENAPKHALIALADKARGQPYIDGSRCQCYDKTGEALYEGDYSKVSFGDDFVIVINASNVVKRSSLTYLQQYRISRVDRKFNYNGYTCLINKLVAANRRAEYYTKSLAHECVVYRKVNIELITLSSLTFDADPVFESIRSEFSMSSSLKLTAAIDDSSLLAFGTFVDNNEGKMCLFDVASDRTTRTVKLEKTDPSFPSQSAARGPNTWVMSLHDETDFHIYDDRVEDWCVVTHKICTQSENEEGFMSSCIDDIVLMDCTDLCDEDSPSFASALDLRNGGRYDLATLCNQTQFIHLQL